MKIYSKKNLVNHGIWFVFQDPLPKKERRKKFLILSLTVLIPCLLESIPWIYPKTEATIIAVHEVEAHKRGTFDVPVLALHVKNQEMIYPMKASEYYLTFVERQIGDKLKVAYRMTPYGEVKSVTILSPTHLYPFTLIIILMYVLVFALIYFFRYMMLDRHRYYLQRLRKNLNLLKSSAIAVNAKVQKVHTVRADHLNGIDYQEIYLDVFYFDQEKWQEYRIQTYRFYVYANFQLVNYDIPLYIDSNDPQHYLLDIDEFIQHNTR